MWAGPAAAGPARGLGWAARLTELVRRGYDRPETGTTLLGTADRSGALAVDAVSDLERDQAIRVLRERYGRGELSLDQFSAQLDDAFAASTRAELARVAGDGFVPCSGESPHGVYETLRRQLASGERVRWIGQPDPRQLRSAMNRLLIPVGALLGFWTLIMGLSVLRVGSTSHGRTPAPYYPVWGVLAILVVFLAVALPLLYRVASGPRRRRTLYAVTDRRVLRVSRHRGGEDVTALELSAVPSVTTRTRLDGSGTVVFGPGAIPQAALAIELSGRGLGGPMALVGIRDAAKVAELIRDIPERQRHVEPGS